MSITTLLQQINLADVNQTGKVSWSGENGEKSIFQNMVGLLAERGVYYLPALVDGSPNISGMGALGGADTKLLLVEKLGMYVFDSNGANVLPTSVTAVGGLWQLILPVSSSYSVTQGTGLTNVTITHNLNTLTPTVQVFSLPLVGNYPTTLNKDVTVTVLSPNSVGLEFPTATTYNSLINIKR